MHLQKNLPSRNTEKSYGSRELGQEVDVEGEGVGTVWNSWEKAS